MCLFTVLWWLLFTSRTTRTWPSWHLVSTGHNLFQACICSLVLLGAWHYSVPNHSHMLYVKMQGEVIMNHLLKRGHCNWELIGYGSWCIGNFKNIHIGSINNLWITVPQCKSRIMHAVSLYTAWVFTTTSVPGLLLNILLNFTCNHIIRSGLQPTI